MNVSLTALEVTWSSTVGSVDDGNDARAITVTVNLYRTKTNSS